MRIEQLEYIAAVARLGSFRAAAEQLHISQPALSETIRNLERELDVHILDRKNSGATVSDTGRELLPHMITALDAIDNLRRAANDQHQVSRMVRVGTVNTATVPLVVPAIQLFRRTHPETQVEVVGAQQSEIHRSILQGGFDLGLVNYLVNDDVPPELDTTELLFGQAVVCMAPDSPLAALRAVRVADLLTEPLIVMRSGYVMHRFLYRLLDGRIPSISYSTDGAEMGKLMVSQGLGVTVLPDFSVIGDPLERSRVIAYRPLDLGSADAGVRLVLHRLRSNSVPQAASDLHQIFVQHARFCSADLAPAG